MSKISMYVISSFDKMNIKRVTDTKFEEVGSRQRSSMIC